MSIDVEFAIKKDIRNNPVVRGVDVHQQREFLRTLGLGALIVGMLLFSVWQHYMVVHSSYQVEDLRKARAEEERLNRQLRLELEMRRSPQWIAQRAADELHMIAPSSRDTLVIELVPAAVPSRANVAAIR